jgi:ATP-dependent RNA helicase RhlE
MNFNQFNLDSRLNTGIQNSGFRTPTPIQESAIPLALAGRDLIGTAQTGTGKTAAFVLPILHKLLNGPRNRTQVLIITPTRELAEQINQTIKELAKGTNLRSATIYGGVGASPQIEALKRGVEIIVACPGRLLDIIQNNNIRLDGIKILVLDEADRMLDMGFLPDIKRILKLVPKQRQTMLFSATFPNEIEQLAAQTLNNPERVSMGIARPAHTVAHTLYPVPQHLKREMVLKILENTETDSILIFARTKHRAQKLARQLAQSGYEATALHGNRSQSQRTAALSGFKSGKFPIMVATDIAARGLDIESISHVINFDMPDTPDAYIHRIGRTGRAKRTGAAFTLTTPEDYDMIRKIEKIMNEKIKEISFPDFDYKAAKPEGQPNSGGQRSQGSRNPGFQERRGFRKKVRNG